MSNSGMRTTGPSCGCCDTCRVERDPFSGEVLSPKWNVVSDATDTAVADGKLVLSPDAAEIIEVVRQRDLLAEGHRGAKVVIEGRLQNFDGAGSAQAVRMAWESNDTFLELWCVTVPTTGAARITLRRWAAGTITTLRQLDDITVSDPEAIFRLEVCLFEHDADAEERGWILSAKVTLPIGGVETEIAFATAVDEPTTLRTSLAASNRAYEFDNWELHKVDEDCPCFDMVPTMCCAGVGLPPQLYLTLTVIDPGDPACDCGVADFPIPRQDGSPDPYEPSHTTFDYQEGLPFLTPYLFCKVSMIRVRCPSNGLFGFFVELHMEDTGIGLYRFLLQHGLTSGVDVQVVSCDPFYAAWRSDRTPNGTGPGYINLAPVLCEGEIYGFTREPVFYIEIHE